MTGWRLLGLAAVLGGLATQAQALSVTSKARACSPVLVSLTQQSGSTYLIDCGNGLTIAAPKGTCIYPEVGTYAVMGTRTKAGVETPDGPRPIEIVPGPCEGVTTSTVRTSSSTTEPGEPVPSTTSTTNPDQVKFPALRATALDVNYKRQRPAGAAAQGGLACWKGHYATQPERAALQGEIIKLQPSLARYARRMGLEAERKKVDDLLVITGVRFFGNTGAYEGRTYPPQLDPWTINLQGAGDLYQFGWYRPRSLHDASLANETARKRCAQAATQDDLDYMDLHVEAGQCRGGALGATAPRCDPDEDRGTEGLIVGSKVFKLNDAERTSLHGTHDVHLKVSAARCDRTLPAYPGAVEAAHRAYENLVGSQPGATVAHQHFSRMPDFSGYADTYRNRTPLDPDDATLYWTDADECTWGKVQDAYHEKWMEAQEQGLWGVSQFFARGHQFSHLCMGYKSDGFQFEFPRADGKSSDEVTPQTCAEYLAAFRANGDALP